MRDDKRQGPLRMICVVCGSEIEPVPQLVNGRAVQVTTERHGVQLDSAYAHKTCHTGDTLACDITGLPDFAGYDEDGAKPAYTQNYDPVTAGAQADAAILAYKARKGLG